MLVSDALATGLVPSLFAPRRQFDRRNDGGTRPRWQAPGNTSRDQAVRQNRGVHRLVARFQRTNVCPRDGGRGRPDWLESPDEFVDDPAEINGTLLERLKREGAEVIVLQPIFTGAGIRIVPIAANVGLPVIGDYPPLADAGALFSFGVDDAERFRRLAYFVDRILKGAKPADLPVEQPTSFQLSST